MSATPTSNAPAVQASAVEAPAAGKPAAPSDRGDPRTIAGLVTSAKMQKTIVVRVERLEKHPKYGKFLRRHSRFKAHDEKGDAKEGDIVAIAQTRPLSLTKRWRLVRIITRAKG